MPTLLSTETRRIGFGGGCHWCTEAVFAALRGVERVEQGFIRCDAPDDCFSEGVVVTFQPNEISLSTLIEIHLRTHSSTSNHSMRGKYRSAVYAMDAAQAQAARKILAFLAPEFDAPLVTRVLLFRAFKASAERFQRYAEKHVSGPFCTNYIAPKLALLRQEYSRFVRPQATIRRG